jgi:glycosyltransferase involved in cell wall biosynthesis
MRLGSHKHFVFISTNIFWGGSENLWSTAARRALQEGHRLSIYASNLQMDIPEFASLAELGAQVTFWPHKRLPPPLVERLKRRLFRLPIPAPDWWAKNLIPDADAYCISQGGPFCATKMEDLTSAILATNRPYICLARSDRVPFPCDEAWRREAKRFYEGASCFIGACEANVEFARLRLGGKLEGGFGLHSPIRDFSGGIAAWPRGETLRLACVGRLMVSEKGQEILLGALNTPIWRERNFHLSFYGDGPDLLLLNDLVAIAGLKDKVSFCGHTQDVSSIWASNHLCVQPSYSEGVPQSMLEAMLARRPILATAVSGIPEWVEEGKTGFLVEAATPTSLRQALERAWANRHRWMEIGEAARRACLAKRDLDPVDTLLARLEVACDKNGVAASQLSSPLQKIP